MPNTAQQSKDIHPDLTDAQRAEIDRTVAYYPKSPANVEFVSVKAAPVGDWGRADPDAHPPGSVEAQFIYRYLDDNPEGTTGLEVGVIAPDGEISDWQDFG